MNIFNLILTADAYKFSHFLFSPKDTTSVTAYIEARGFTAPFTYEPEVLFNGLDIFIKEYLTKRITHRDVDKAALIALGMGIPFNLDGWRAIVNDFDGYLPLYIEALPEGTPARPGIPLVQLTNTDDRFFWLVSYIETALLRAIWYPTTAGTLSREMKKVIIKWLDKTGDNRDPLPFLLNDFSARGVETHEAARIGGIGHLINFSGTDNTEAVEAVYDHYNGVIVGGSIPSTEHSISTAYDKEHEVAYVESVLDLIEKTNGMAGVVADTYNIYNFLENVIGVELRDRITKLQGKLVIRPDSGDPLEMTLAVIEALGKAFGYTINSKGYKVLPKYIGMIQGDGVSFENLDALFSNFAEHGWATENLVLGCGGALMQKINRDTLKFAQKANEVQIGDTIKAIFKAPITDAGKKSKAGRQYVIEDTNGKLVSLNSAEWNASELAIGNLLIPRYYNGGELNPSTFAQIRERAEIE